MAPNRITWGGTTLAVLLIGGILAGCGGGGSSTATSSEAAATTPAASREESADAAILDTVLARQEAAVEAFRFAMCFALLLRDGRNRFREMPGYASRQSA